MENKKKFQHPEAIIVAFSDEDIIVTSGDLNEGYPQEPGDENQL